MKSMYEKNFDRLVKIGLITEDGKQRFEYNAKLKSGAYMDLSIDYIECAADTTEYTISLAHNYEQNGDIMADPDMEIRINPVNKTVEALTFQQDNLGIYQRVYVSKNSFYPKLKDQLNSFLSQWLQNLINQGFVLA